MTTHVELGEGLKNELSFLQREVELAYSSTVRPLWSNETRHFPGMLYGFLMNAFAFVDLVSRYWSGSRAEQGRRMVDWLERYLGRDREACYIAVKLWRHTLMHTAAPRLLHREDTGSDYVWLLHWADELPSSQHFVIEQINPSRRKLNLSLKLLLAELGDGLEAYLKDVAASQDLQLKMIAVHPQIERQRFRSPRWL